MTSRPLERHSASEIRATTVRRRALKLAPPVSRASDPARHRPSASSNAGERPAVLLIDDDRRARSAIPRALEEIGLDILCARSGEEGLRLLRERPVEVIVCDLVMPGISGLDVVRALRKDPRTATLPFLLMTGSTDSHSVIAALHAGADDFLRKPIRLDELVARVRAHLRTQTAWSDVVEKELRGRAAAVAALGRLSIPSDPQGAAALLVRELGQRTRSQHVSVLRVTAGGGLEPLASFSLVSGVESGGQPIGPPLGRDLLQRTREGPWVRRVSRADQSTTPLWDAHVDLVAGAPIYSADRLVAMVNLGIALDPEGPQERAREARLLGEAIDFAGVLGAVAGAAIAHRNDVASERARLVAALRRRDFRSVYQPIIQLTTRQTIGHEALTRFDDGTQPDTRFAEASACDLGSEYELAAIELAVAGSRTLPANGLLALNVSPAVILTSGRALRGLVRDADREVVLELTEHVAIDDYALLRRAIANLHGVGIAVDDAGAGYASLRHLVELRPTFAKLDMSLVRNIHADPLRQALAAGLGYYARRTGCRLIAEGVEAEEEAQTLDALGVGFAQGYLFGRPGPAPVPPP